MELAGRVALVTGSKRIGAVVATELARGGADVAIVHHTSDGEAERAAESVRAIGRRAVVLQANLRQAGDCGRIVADTVAALGRLDILVNLASVYRARPFDETTLDDWDAAMEVDLRASWLCARAAAPEMRRRHGGRIINFSDWVAHSRRPRYPGYLPYYVAKAGVSALTEALALELASDQILVNAIAPGPIVAPEAMSEADVDAVKRATPLGRWGGEAEVAKAVLALIASDFMTGETVRVDGGRHLR